MTPHPYYSEIDNILNLLTDKGYTFVSVDDGGDDDVIVDSHTQALETILSVDCSQLWLSKDSKNYWIDIVLGNEPGVALADYSINDDFDAISEEVYEMFNQ